MNDQLLHPGVAHEVDALKHANADGYQQKPGFIDGAVIISFFSRHYFLTQFVYDNGQEWEHDLELLKTALPELNCMNEALVSAALGSQAEGEKDAITFKSAVLAMAVDDFEQLRVTNYRRIGDGDTCSLRVYRGHTDVGTFAYDNQPDREHDITNMLKLHPLLIEMGQSQPA
jgi:hypothetical protein